MLAVPAAGKGKPKPKPKPKKPVVTKPVVKPVVPAAPKPKRNGKIAWVRDGNIWLMNGDGSSAAQLTSSPDDAPVEYSTPSWSPDGSKLAYVATDDSGATAVYVSGADGQNGKKIADGGADPSWSPDGKQLAFSNDDGDNTAIFVVPSAGGDARKLCTAPGFLNQPAWSPDGKQIAYRREAVDNQSDALVIASSTGCAEVGTTGADDSTPSFAWNFALAFVRSDDNGDQDIFVRPKGGSAKDVTVNPDVNDYSPQFSPDGNKIVFVSDRDGNAEIYVMNADGSNQVNLTNDPPATDGGDCDPEADVCDPGTLPPDDADPAWQPL
ncbi:MAG TPA: LpqB family beta-propeller domain-containing protein [Gaiellaceae bacterium]